MLGCLLGQRSGAVPTGSSRLLEQGRRPQRACDQSDPSTRCRRCELHQTLPGVLSVAPGREGIPSRDHAQRCAFLHRTTPRGKRPPSAHSTVARARRVARSPTSGHPAGTGSGFSMSKAIGSSRRARPGAGGWLRTTMAPSARAPIANSRIALRRDVAPRRLLTGRASTDGRPGGEGSAGRRLGRARDVRARAPVCARFRARLRSPARVRTGARVSSRATVSPAWIEMPACPSEQERRPGVVFLGPVQPSRNGSRLRHDTPTVVTSPLRLHAGRCGLR